MQIIRLLRKIVAVEKQTGWPTFCHQVALPLRDGISSRERLLSVSNSSRPSPYVLVTRRRYDLQAVVLLPLGVAIALAGLWKRIPQLVTGIKKPLRKSRRR